MALIRMEETRSGLTPFCNNFSKNAIEERIVAIMKIKKTSLVALIVAVALVTGVITVFATSAEANKETALMPAETPISTDNPQTPTAKPDTSTEIPSNDIGVSSDYISAPCSKGNRQT